MNKIQKNNFGLDYDRLLLDKKSDTNYVFGAVDKIVLREDGQWLDFYPECEIQKTHYTDLMDCVTESAINAISIILQLKFKILNNWSQRFTAKMSGTTNQGNSPYRVADSVRHDGLTLEIDWPRDSNMTWNQYYSSIPYSVIGKGKKFVLQFDVNYESVPTNPSAIKEALKYAPIQTIGFAWASKDGIYYDYGYRPNHAFLIVGYEEGKYWYVYDSYPTDYVIDENSTKQEFLKKLDWNFNFGDAMLFSVKLKDANKQSWLFKIINMLKNLKWNFWVNKKDPSKGLANGEIYIVKDGKKKLVNDINDVMAVLEINFGIEKTDWGELGNYKTVERF